MSEKGRTQSDWERIERDYRAGVKSVREIAAQHSVSHTAIQKRAKADGWERDLNAKIKAKAEAKVAKAQVAKLVAIENKATEAQLVEVNAEALAQVRLSHRADIGRARSLVSKLLGELEATTDNAELFAQLGEMLRQPDDNGRDRTNDLYRKVISLSGRVSDLKALSEAMTKLVTLERQAWSMDEPAKSNDDDPTGMTDDELDAKINARLGALGAGAGVAVH